jgi:peptide/nickel transport system ATP-binding protein
MPLLDVDHLVVDLATPAGTLHAVREVSFHVERGETLCIVGETGCGKSMTALALMGLLPRSAIWRARHLAFDGENLNASSIGRLRGNRMAMVFQEPTTALNPCYTIGDQLSEAHRRHKGSSQRAARERAIEILEKVGVSAATERLSQYPHQLSGGLRQRVLISMALICDPALLIADEPTSALDATIQAQILRLLVDLQCNLGIAILLITHDLGVVARVAHRVAVMYAGEVVETATVADLFAAPRHPYTRGLMASIPVPGKTPPGERLAAIPGTVPSLIGEVCGCAFRNRCPHATAICADPIVPRSAADHLWRCVLAELPTETV